MAEASWPDPADGNVVAEWQYEQLAARFSGNGLNGGPFDAAAVTAGPGMAVTVKAGRAASVRGFHWESGESDVTVSISANDSGGTRTDWVVLRLDRSTWQVRVAVREGSPGSPAPALVQQPGPTGVYEVPLATVTVPPGAVQVTSDMVTYRPLFIGSRIRPATLGRNPSPAPGELGWVGGRNYESYDGSSWAALLEDTGWIPLSPANEANWSNHTIRCRRLNGVVYVDVNVRREGTALSTNSSDAAQGSHLLTLPAGMRPAQNPPKTFPTTLTAGISARLRVYIDGQVYLQAPSHEVGVGRFLRHSFDFPIG